MLKKFALGFAAVALAVATVPMFAAFEAHVINVTARIENAMQVSPSPIEFGTVFPQEALHKPVTVSMSESFVSSDALGIRYMLRQKPKCQIVQQPTGEPALPDFAQVTENADGEFVCPTGYRQMLLLCPYLSKHSDDTADQSLASFHGPITGWNPTTTESFQLNASITKGTDPIDVWDIDLHVPCFEGMCAQDWAKFVKATNPNADPAAYIQPAANEHQLFGCDLWFETTGIVRQ